MEGRPVQGYLALHPAEMLQASELTITMAPRDQRYLVEYEIAVGCGKVYMHIV
jgi:hypothetical protein